MKLSYSKPTIEIHAEDVVAVIQLMIFTSILMYSLGKASGKN